MPGAPGVLAVEIAALNGRLALVSDPAMPHHTLAFHVDGRTDALRLDNTAIRVLGLACREATASGNRTNDNT
jgi:hypothetical protein